MKILYSTENGSYLDAKVAHIFFSDKNNKEFFAVENTSIVFSRLNMDQSFVAVVKVDDSYNGDNTEVLDYLQSGKFKVFGELFISPKLHLVSKEKVRIENIQKVYLEPWSLVFLKNSDALFLKHIQIEVIQDVECIIQHENTNFHGFIITESLAKTSKDMYIIKKNICNRQAGILRYLVVGLSFFDLPSEKSDKAIVIFRSNQDKYVFDEILNQEGMTVFKFLSKPSKTSDAKFDYYLEIGFHGLLDLATIEKNSTYFNILGIFESGKFFVV